MPPIHVPTQPPSTLLCDQRWSSSALQHLHHTLILSFGSTLFLSMSSFFPIRYSPFFFLLLCCCCPSVGCLVHVICLCGDQCCCSWWIPTIQRVREQGSEAVTFKLRLSNRSLSDVPYTVNKRKRRGWRGEMAKIKFIRLWSKQRKNWGEAQICSSGSKISLFLWFT